MSGRTFDHLQTLEIVSLCSNLCINESFDGKNKSIVEAVEEKCGYPEINLECGKSDSLHGAVQRGKLAKRGQWPFLVALKKHDGNEFFCGGNLITSRHVMTGEQVITSNEI